MNFSKISEVFIVARGGSPRPIQDFITEEDGVNWIMIGDTIENEKYINITKKKIKIEGVKKSRKVYPGDFLLTNSMSFGRPYILNIEGCIHDGWLVLSPKKDNINKDFMYYCLSSDFLKKQISLKAAGAVVKNLNSEIVRDIQIPLPPLEQQKEIAEKLDKADLLRKKDQELLAQYDELAQAIFIDMFGDPIKNEKGWEVSTIKNSINLITYGLTVRPEYLKEGIPLISAREIRTGYINFDDAPKISQNDYDKLTDKGKPKKGDILFSKTGTIGLSAIVLDGCCFGITQNCARLSFKEELVDYIFALEQLRNNEFLTKCKSLVKGNAVKDLQLGDFSNMEIILPPLSLQNQFAEKIKNVEAQKALAKKQAQESEDLFQALLQESFNFNS